MAARFTTFDALLQIRRIPDTGRSGWQNAHLIEDDIIPAVTRIKETHKEVRVIGSCDLLQTLLERPHPDPHPSPTGTALIRPPLHHPVASKTPTLRMDNVEIVVEDLQAAITFFSALGLELEGEAKVEGDWVDRILALEGVQTDIAMMRTPDGHGGIELVRFRHPKAVRAGPDDAPVNALGIRRIMFAVDDLEATLDRLQDHGAAPIGEIVRYEDAYRLCFLRGPEGIILALAEEL